MNSEEILDLVRDLKDVGVLFFEGAGIKVAFPEPLGASHGAAQPAWTESLFSDQKAVVEELAGADTVDPDGKPAQDESTYSDADLFGSSQ